MPGLKKQRELLYVALLLHDIAKGRPEDHSAAGARIARRICPHMGLSPADTETVAWLVEQHLLMSMTAQTRDLNDRKTIDDFAAVVQIGRAAEDAVGADRLRHHAASGQASGTAGRASCCARSTMKRSCC